MKRGNFKFYLCMVIGALLVLQLPCFPQDNGSVKADAYANEGRYGLMQAQGAINLKPVEIDSVTIESIKENLETTKDLIDSGLLDKLSSIYNIDETAFRGSEGSWIIRQKFYPADPLEATGKDSSVTPELAPEDSQFIEKLQKPWIEAKPNQPLKP